MGPSSVYACKSPLVPDLKGGGGFKGGFCSLCITHIACDYCACTMCLGDLSVPSAVKATGLPPSTRLWNDLLLLHANVQRARGTLPERMGQGKERKGKMGPGVAVMVRRGLQAAVPEGGGAGGPAQKAGPSAALSGQRSLRAGPGEAQAGREEPYVLEPEDGEGQGERYDDASAAPQVSERPRLPGPGRGTKLGHVAHRYRDHAELQTLKLASKGQPPGSDGECDSPAPKSYGPRSERGF